MRNFAGFQPFSPWQRRQVSTGLTGAKPVLGENRKKTVRMEN
jgi:hypothetical protein